MTQGFLSKLRLTLDMIKFEHSVFALPFAFSGAVLAMREDQFQTASLVWKICWITVAMVAARSAAMAFNRLFDAEIDGLNPRTRMRHIPSGLLGKAFAWRFVAASSLLFCIAAGALNSLCLWLSPLALAIVFFYTFTKRFTPYSHVVLGFALGIAPSAAWIAIRGNLDPRILWLTAAVTFWTAGFDIIYACQDYDFDRQQGLHSLPSKFGIAHSLWGARLLHIAMLACLIALSSSFQLGWISTAGIAIVAALLVYEHLLVKAHDLSRVDAAFFTVNGYVSVLFFLFLGLDIFLFRRGI